VVPPKDAHAWAHAAARLLGDPDYQQHLLHRIRAYAASTTWDLVAGRHAALYV
jgi:glycosyltransferase involved in cell wall biosynthesis